jgi:hypothetical protein
MLHEVWVMNNKRVWVKQMFMWMLHEVWLMNNERDWVKKMFMWMSHEVCVINGGIRLIEENVYMNVTWSLEWWIIKEFECEENVYVNVTWSMEWWIMKEFEWRECLCKCYMKFGVANNERVWVKKMFMWMLHEVWVLNNERVWVGRKCFTWSLSEVVNNKRVWVKRMFV